MTGLLVVLVSTAVFVAAAMIVKGRAHQRSCPTCRVPYDVVAHAGDGANATYDVLACPQCSNTATLVHGSRNHLSYCPACSNRTLETPTMRKPGNKPSVEVHEHCHLCSYEHTYEVRTSAPLGMVIPFPSPRSPRTGAKGGR